MAAQEKPLYSFSFNKFGADGAAPNGNLVFDTEGNLYGSCLSGGPGDGGGVFELSPKAGGVWTKKWLTDSTGAVLGAGTQGSLIFDVKGNLYGVGSGGVIEFSPETNGNWKEQTIYTFSGEADVNGANAGLIFDSKGNLYGTSHSGGKYFSYGTVFELSPKAGGGWTENILHSFDYGFVDGWDPLGSLVFDAKGNLYGTTEYGGANGLGTVYELTPGTGGVWTEKILYNLTSSPLGGSNPYANLIFDTAGNLYSTAFAGGSGGVNVHGAVFELTEAGGVWSEDLLHSFAEDATDGGDPASGLLFDAKGNLYSTTFHGGPYYTQESANTDGTIFELLPQASGGWAEQVLHIFGSIANDGVLPAGGVIADAKGNLYGVTSEGGEYGYGTVYEYTPVPTAGLPEISPAGGVYTAAQSVTIKDATTGATIYYTTDGSTPTAASKKYGGAIDVAKTTTIQAIGVVKGLANSPVAAATYTIEGITATPVFTPPGGSYTTVQMVTITDATAGAAIHYTMDGTEPTAGSATYYVPIQVATSVTLKAIAIASGDEASAVTTAAYTLPARTPPPTFSPAAGAYVATQMVKLTDANAKAVMYYTTNGTLPTTASTKYTVPFAVSATGFVHAIAVAPGDLPSAEATARYVIGATALTPQFSPLPGPYATAQTVYLTDFTIGAQIRYTTNGATPTATSALYSAPLKVTSTETIKAIAIAPGYKNSLVALGLFTIEKPAATPVFSPLPGSFTAAQSVKITDTTPGAVIYYTTDGKTTPTAASTKYTAAIAVKATETIKAIALATGYTPSAVATGLFTIEKPAVAPVFSPAAGSFTAAQSVKITDATPGAVLYYTTDGKTTPTTSSTKYTAAIAVSATETIKAIAVAPGYTPSVVATATFTITPSKGVTATPTFSPGAESSATGLNVKIADATSGALIYYTTNGTTPTIGSTKYTSAGIAVSQSETIEAIAIAPGYSASKVASAKYTIGIILP